jgi:site-specific DNA recombinase
MIAALYLRVSTESQAEDGFSIAAQLRLLQDYCQRNNIEIYKVYSDEGISGQKENRPQFQAMLRDAEKKLFNIILVHKFDRFARKVEISQKIKNQLRKTNINVISATEPIEDSPMGFFVSGLHDLMAEYYIRNLALESKKGHIERAKQGYHNGSVPYGYYTDRETGIPKINEEQAKIVRWIFEMYNKEGKGSTKIAAILNEHGILTAVNGTWAHFTVSRILHNVKYIGKILYDGEVYQGKHEPIISEEEFYLAQQNIKDRTWKREYRGSNYNKFLFLGLLRCGICKKVMKIHSNLKSTSKRTNSSYYYICNNASHTDNPNRCQHRKCYSTKLLEEHLLKEIKHMVKSVKAMNVNIIERNSVEDILINQKNKMEIELDRIKKAYIAGVFSLEEYQEEKNRILDQIKSIELSEKQNTDKEKEKRFQQKARTIWEEFEQLETIEERKLCLKKIIDVIYITSEGIDIDVVL